MSAVRLFALERVGTCLVVVLSGEMGSLADSQITAELDHALGELRKPEVRHLIVDFAQMPYFGSILLEGIRSLWKEIDARHGNMALCNVSLVGKEILGIARFDTLWPIFATRAEAVRSVEDAV